MEGDSTKLSPPPYERFTDSATDYAVDTPPTAYMMPQPSAPASSTAHVVTIAQNVPVMQNFGPKPQIAFCTHCNIRGKTKVKSQATSKAHCWACIFFLIGFWPCICCPYCCCDCSKKFHHCGNCNAFLGTYDP